MKNAFAVLVCAGVLGSVVAAHAAPAGPNPQISKDQNQLRPVAAIDNGVDVKESIIGCGTPWVAHVNIANGGAATITGKVDLSVPGASGSTPYEVPAKGSKVVDVKVGKALNCKGALGTGTVEVYKGATKVETRTLSPKAFKAERFFPQPPPSNPAKVWLRRMSFGGTCGGVAAYANADLMLLGGGSQAATISLDWGTFSTPNATVTVPGNQATMVKVYPTGTFDCQTAAGIPTMNYAFPGSPAPTPANGSLDVTEVQFLP